MRLLHVLYGNWWILHFVFKNSIKTGKKKNKVAILPKLGKHHFKNNSFLSRIDMTLHDNEYETVQYSKQSFESHEELS